MKINFLIILASTLVPLVVGMIWYSPKIGFGKAWMAATGMTEESGKGANMVLIFTLLIVFSFLMTIGLMGVVIHQFALYSLLGQQPDFPEPNSEPSQLLNHTMELYGHSFRSFKHGALHGTLAGIMLALPIIAINAMFERRRFKYIAINTGYFIVCFALMGGLLCAFL